ncbi:Rieske 2Fe-2S domain-containing protein [Pedobacter aquatilis]|uniref:Rieske 2Fe-2S domain-containing protein n=1 Tax=Pedobacter aquatilis TaxID=351343 RepID=UPI00292ECBD6|nr:Rieske 2Fe-2S domain-containing protein [Pedobacter aquatilis]
MERNEFIKSLGLGVALVCTGSCFAGCGSKGDDPQPPPPGGNPPAGGATVNLSTQLLTVGASLVVSGILFIRTATGNAATSFAATQAVCPHQGGSLGFIQASNYIQCSLHSARYTTGGAILAQPNDGGTTSALKVYALSINGSTLTAS